MQGKKAGEGGKRSEEEGVEEQATGKRMGMGVLGKMRMWVTG